jgi:hypothetical protein
MALGKAGISQQIDSLEFSESETVPTEARSCLLYWDLAYEAAARDHDWKCLTKRANISASITTAPTFGFSYAYSLPADCLRVLRMEDPDVEWTREGRTLLTDEIIVKIKYLRRTDDTDLFDPHFVEALVTLLAAHLASSLMTEQGVSIAEKLGLWYERVTLPRARFTDSTESSGQSLESSTWLNSRL